MTSRRSFFKQLAIGAAAFSILPSASTYSRIWKPKAIVPVRYEVNPAWVNAEYELYVGQWHLAGNEWKCFYKIERDRQPMPNSMYPPQRFNNVSVEYVHVSPFVEVTA